MSTPAPTVLIIEDDAQVRRFLRITLEADGIAVLEAARGRDGISQAGGQMPALVMLDLGLPDMDGLDVIRELRSTATMPIIVLSARSAEAQKVAALDAGADDYLTKPFGNLELMARLRVHLRKRARAAADAGAPVRFGDICVDLALRQVTRAGAPVHLTPTEYQLLGVLLRHAGKVLTHTYLLREVWGGGHAERSHYLRIYMANLRRKLERDAARPVYLTTETGVGYRLCLNDERVEELKWT